VRTSQDLADLPTCRNDENLEKVRNAINADRRRIIDEISEINGLSWTRNVEQR